jgi:hypothetical protein
MVSMMVIKTGVGEDAGSTSRATSINWGYVILHMALAQHAEQIKLDILVLENQILFAAVKMFVASCGSLKLWHFVEQVVLECFTNVGTRWSGSVTRLSASGAAGSPPGRDESIPSMSVAAGTGDNGCENRAM